VRVTAGDREIGRVTLQSYFDTHRTLDLPALAVRDGACTLTLTGLSPPSDASPGGTIPQLWFDRVRATYDARPRLVDGRLTVANDESGTGPFWTPLPDAAGAQDTTAARLIALRVEDDPETVRLWPIGTNAQGERGIAWSGETGARMRVYDTASVPPAPRIVPQTFDDLGATDQGADLLIVTHPEFREAAERLAVFHRERGLRVRTTEIQQVYNQFNHGEFSPLAIRSLLAYMMGHWRQGAPAWVILVGDSNSDYKSVARNEVRNWVPTYTHSVGGEEWASDHYLTMVAGDDDFGDFMIGRLSVANREDAATVVDKIIQYAGQPKLGPWRARLGFVADDGEFPDVVDELRREETPPAFRTRRVFLNEMPLEDNWYLDPEYVADKHMKVSRAATQGILDALRDGVACLTYYGHGSPNIWADERIWFGGDTENSDNLQLAGSGHMSFIANMTCNSGAIDYPDPPWNICITEDMMRVPDGGAIACYVPSGPGVTSTHRRMSDALHRVLFDDGVRGLGAATTLAKLRYTLERLPREMTLMYLLLGDPAIDLEMAPDWRMVDLPRAAYAPGTTIAAPLGGIQPARGQWQAELVNDSGERLWQSAAAEYRDGRIDVAAAIPAGAKAGGARLSVYAWDETSRRDLAIGARLRLERPRLEIAALTTNGQTSRSLPARSATLEVRNPTGVEAAGTLEWVLWDGMTTRTLSGRDVTLSAGGKESFELPLTQTAAEEPQVVEARLTMASAPDDPAVAKVASQRVAVAYPSDWTGWVPALASMEVRPVLRTVQVTLPLATTAGVRRVEAGLSSAQGERVFTQPLYLDPGPTHRSAALKASLTQETLKRLEGGTAWIAAQADATTLGLPSATQPRAERSVLASLPIESVAQRQPGLRIVPGSIHARPDRPSDGETIFVDFAVENAGDLDTEPTMVGLFDRPQEEGGQRLNSLETPNWLQVPRLAPGRRVEMTLRWDPNANAGRQRLWVQLMTQRPAAREVDTDLAQSTEVDVRTKWKLRITDVLPTATLAERDARTLNLYATLHNDGQTEARGVIVTFYRSELRIVENRIAEVFIDRVPGESSVVAHYVWRNHDLVRGTTFTLSANGRLKGSSQRFLNEPPRPGGD
jgi:hypothetical protein